MSFFSYLAKLKTAWFLKKSLVLIASGYDSLTFMSVSLHQSVTKNQNQTQITNFLVYLQFEMRRDSLAGLLLQWLLLKKSKQIHWLFVFGFW